MIKSPPINYSRIEEMAEGDEDFKNELIFAIHTSLLDLKVSYLQASTLKDDETLHMVRHKVKPTLVLFNMERLSQTINAGKTLIEENGFDQRFSEHRDQFLRDIDEALEEAQSYMAAAKK